MLLRISAAMHGTEWGTALPGEGGERGAGRTGPHAGTLLRYAPMHSLRHVRRCPVLTYATGAVGADHGRRGGGGGGEEGREEGQGEGEGRFGTEHGCASLGARVRSAGRVTCAGNKKKK
eukprot:1092393-Rhodomonas_salina.2